MAEIFGVESGKKAVRVVYQNIYSHITYDGKGTETGSAYHRNLNEARLGLDKKNKNYLRTEKLEIDPDGEVLSRETVQFK